MPARKYFGTDGVRGKVGELPITPELVMRLGYSAGKVLAMEADSSHAERPGVLIGKDTRVSGYMLESALQAGLSAAGVDIHLAGPMPTPAVAYLTRALRLQAGIVISASHNPFEDNGIKFFSDSGNKLPDEIEHAIEAGLDQPLETMPSARLGKAWRLNDAAGRYIEFCKSTYPYDLHLRGLKIVVDCAHGATYHIAASVFHELGAEVVAIGNAPDGFNINHQCGATQPQAMLDAVKQHKADVGIALDGDGDRVLMADADGALYDGDTLLYVIARCRRKHGLLRGGVVGTLMTNLGLERALGELDLPFARAAVGDRYVLELLLKNDWQLGGEGSGHIICLDKHTTGDGIISALQVLHALQKDGISFKAAASQLRLYPQVLINVRVAKGFDFRGNAKIASAVKRAEEKLDGSGRVLLRASGTEPLVRVMTEGEPETLIREAAEAIAETVRKESQAKAA
ncbi:MAG: phosphoglucosamine mutase [Burkholderiales bacterium]